MSAPDLRLPAIRKSFAENLPRMMDAPMDYGAFLEALEKFEAHVARAYAPRSELDALRERVTRLEARLDVLQATATGGRRDDG